MHFFFKAEHKSQGYYVDCEWMNDVDFAVKDQNEAPICKVTVSDVNQFWSGTVHRRDLDSFLRPEDSEFIPKLNQVVRAAFQGETEFEGHNLSWRAEPSVNECELSLFSDMGSRLLYQVGYFKVPRVPKSEHDNLIRNWMEHSVLHCAKAKQVERVLSQRNYDLVHIKASMERRLEETVNEKVDADMTMMQRFKEIINSKKRRIRLLLNERDQLKRAIGTESAAPEESSVSGKARTSKLGKRGRAARTEFEEEGEDKGKDENEDKDKDKEGKRKSKRTKTQNKSSQPRSNTELIRTLNKSPQPRSNTEQYTATGTQNEGPQPPADTEQATQPHSEEKQAAAPAVPESSATQAENATFPYVAESDEDQDVDDILGAVKTRHKPVSFRRLRERQHAHDKTSSESDDSTDSNDTE